MSASATPYLRPHEKLLALLPGKVRKVPGGWVAQCPAHDDHKASLSVNTANGVVLVKCHAGCDTAQVLAAVGLELADLFPPRPAASLGTPVAHYNYHDRDGKLLYQVVRYAPKDFRQRRPNGKGGWLWNLHNVPRVLYRWPELAAAPHDEPVFVVEGEKDSDRLATLGLVATTNVGGAGKWLAHYGSCLEGRHLVLLPDHDAAGRLHVRGVLDHTATAASRRVLELPGLPPKGDVSDWLDHGGDAATLRQLAATAPLADAWLQTAPGLPPVAAPPAATDDGPVLIPLSRIASRPVEFLWPGRLAAGKLAILDGDPGLGKSLVTLDLAARVTRGQPWPDGTSAPLGDVVVVNCEDGVGDTIRPRLEGMGADLERVHIFQGRQLAGVEYLPTFPADLPRLERAIRTCRARLVIIDPIMAFLDAGILTANDQSVRQALSPLARLADDTGCAVLLVRHLNKSGGAKAVYRGGGSIGIIGACRSAWLIAKNPVEERQRVLAQVKNNLARPQASLAYEVALDEKDCPQVAWLGVCELAADQLVQVASGGGESPRQEEAVEALQELLRAGPRPVEEVMEELRQRGISRATAYRAREALQVESETRRIGDLWRSLWRLTQPVPAKKASPDVLPPLEDVLSLPAPRRRRRGPEDGPYAEGR